jgi:NAD(P)-dependent dehydrogenase (short-subunit alcohol dehydrogenase family)
MGMRGKVIVITGALGALGSVVAARAEAAGATAVRIDYAKQDGADALTLAGVDLSDAAAAHAAIETAHQRAGRIDALLNIAGGFAFAKAEADAAAWERMFALNLKTALNASRAALPHLVESKGAIVNVGANGALKAGAGMGAYAASKSAVHRLTEAMAEELKGRVRVNAVLPSTIDTPQNRESMPKADPTKWVTPDELAAVMLFLASDEASAITGALIPVTGRV